MSTSPLAHRRFVKTRARCDRAVGHPLIRHQDDLRTQRQLVGQRAPARHTLQLAALVCVQAAGRQRKVAKASCWCGREDSNLHGIAPASPSSWCVYQIPPLPHGTREAPSITKVAELANRAREFARQGAGFELPVLGALGRGPAHSQTAGASTSSTASARTFRIDVADNS